MKVLYTGKYREPAVHYRGYSFVDGVAVEVSDEWYEQNKGGSIEAEKQKRGRPKKGAVDGDNN